MARELARPTWIMARQQTAAKGRAGRNWNTGPGNFAATLVFRPGGPPNDAALRSFAAANALYETLAIYADRTRLSVKWPNDVLLDDGKIAGILLEAAGSQGAVDWLAIGFGVNLATAPPPETAAQFCPMSLKEKGVDPPTPDDFLTLLAMNYVREEKLFAKMGFGPIRETWLDNAARLGETITARTMRETIEGEFETMDEAGCLVLRTSAGSRRIAAADIYF